MLPLTTLVPMDLAHQASAQVRVEERVRSGNDIKAAETELNPQVRYDAIWSGGQNHFVALYQPRFLYTYSWDRRLPSPEIVNPATLNLTDPNDTPFSALHNGGLGIEVVRRRWRLSAYQFGAYGPVTTTALLVQAPWGGEGPPPDPNPIIPSTIAARFTLLFLQTQVFLPIRITPRLAITPGFVYNAFGGADAPSRGVIALTQGPGVNVQLDYAATRHDRLISTIGAGRIETTFQDNRDGATIYRAEATQAWRHWWTSHFASEAAAGASFGGDEINGFSLYSLAQVGVNYDTYALGRAAPGAPPMGAAAGHGPRVQVGVVGKVQPWIDLFSGELEQRGVLTFATNYTVDRSTLRALVSTARVFNTPRSVAEYEMVWGEISARYRFTPTIWADAGIRLGYQYFNNSVRQAETTQASVFGALQWAPLPEKF